MNTINGGRLLIVVFLTAVTRVSEPFNFKEQGCVFLGGYHTLLVVVDKPKLYYSDVPVNEKI